MLLADEFSEDKLFELEIWFIEEADSEEELEFVFSEELKLLADSELELIELKLESELEDELQDET
jgi:hypothetical protein